MASADSTHPDPLSFPGHPPAFHLSSATSLPDAMATQLYSNSVEASTTAPVTSQNGWATKEAWARHQPLIKELYQDQSNPLAKVMRLMESQHGFKAT